MEEKPDKHQAKDVDPPPPERGGGDEDASCAPTLDQPAGKDFPAGTRDDVVLPAHKTKIGPFRIKRVIASGGMGTVYEARQDNPSRVVAVKVLRKGLFSRAALRRFEYESQVLARLRHPNIAQVYEAGTHSDPDDPGVKQPYFAMEYIPNARPLTEYASVHELSVDDRLALFAQVCGAVHHGHQKGIIHRDLKPPNILVDSSGRPKIIDFGVARGTDSDLAVTTVQTDVGQLVGTISYMSPEQCDADPNDLDTRSDVYALGVILYELLTGEMPYDIGNKPILEAVRVIKEQRPIRPSIASRIVRGDLEVIVLKALEKDRDRRYASASALADDIQRYRMKQPILARPPSLVYEVRQFARRNRLLVGAGAAIMLAIVSGAAATTIALQRTLRAEHVARQQVQIATGINLFLINDVLAAADPEYQSNRELTVREALDLAAARLDGRFPDEPLIEAGIRHTIGSAYRSLGRADLALAQIRRAVATYSRELGDGDQHTVSARNDMSLALIELGRYDEADLLLQDQLKIVTDIFGEDHVQTYSVWSNIATLRKYTGDIEESVRILERVSQRHEAVLGALHEETLTAQNNLALAYIDQSRFAEAEKLLLACLKGCRAVHGDDHPDTLSTLGNLGNVYEAQGKFDRALEALQDAFERQNRVLGPEHSSTLRTYSSIGAIYMHLGQFDEAEEVFREILDSLKRTLGAEHPDYLTATNNLAAVYNETGRYADAEPLLLESYEAQRRTLGPAHIHTLNSMGNLAFCYDMQGDRERAEPLYREALDIRRRTLGDENLDTMISMWNLGRFYEDGNLFDDAEPLLAEATMLARRTLGDQHLNAAMFGAGYGAFLLDRGRLEAAEDELLWATPVLESVLGVDHDRTQRAILALIRMYESTNRIDRADDWRTKVVNE